MRFELLVLLVLLPLLPLLFESNDTIIDGPYVFFLLARWLMAGMSAFLRGQMVVLVSLLSPLSVCPSSTCKAAGVASSAGLYQGPQHSVGLAEYDSVEMTGARKRQPSLDL